MAIKSRRVIIVDTCGPTWAIWKHSLGPNLQSLKPKCPFKLPSLHNVHTKQCSWWHAVSADRNRKAGQGIDVSQWRRTRLIKSTTKGIRQFVPVRNLIEAGKFQSCLIHRVVSPSDRPARVPFIDQGRSQLYRGGCCWF